MNARDMQLGIDYDLVSPDIRCRADRPGATVFEVLGDGILRVLAHTQADAESAVAAREKEEQ